MLGDKVFNRGIRPDTNEGIAKEMKAQKQGVGGLVEKSLICPPEALAQVDKLELAGESKEADHIQLLKLDCEVHSSWKGLCNYFFSVQLFSLCNYYQASGDGTQTAIGQQDQQLGRKSGCGAEEEHKLKHTRHLSICSLRDFQRTSCCFTSTSQISHKSFFFFFGLKLYKEGDSKKCSSKLNQVNKTVVWLQFLYFYV